jgi:hypothetical protein
MESFIEERNNNAEMTKGKEKGCYFRTKLLEESVGKKRALKA